MTRQDMKNSAIALLSAICYTILGAFIGAATYHAVVERRAALETPPWLETYQAGKAQGFNNGYQAGVMAMARCARLEREGFDALSYHDGECVWPLIASDNE